MAQQFVLDISGKYHQQGIIIDSRIDEDDIKLVYTVQFTDEQGNTHYVEREPYQITYL